MDNHSKGSLRGQGLVQDDVILEPFPSFESSMSYFFLFLVVVLQLFLVTHVFYLALFRDFACVDVCIASCLCINWWRSLIFSCLLAVDPLLLLDSFCVACPTYRPFPFRGGRTWAIAVRRGSYESLFLLNSGRFSLEK